MMKKTTLVIITLILSLNLNAQDYEFRESIDKDSLFDVSIKSFPDEKRIEYEKMYKKASSQEKEFLLFMISMPKSSKTELIENYENYENEILNIKKEYSKIVPENKIVYIEFENASKILTIPEQITIKIYEIKDDNNKSNSKSDKLKRNIETISENWNLKPGSEKLIDIISSLGWTEDTLTEIKNLLDTANCISVKNGDITNIGFARSGMGKYSYKIFEQKLSENQIEEYDNGCEYIFYRDNIVLEYGGGAIGPQCF